MIPAHVNPDRVRSALVNLARTQGIIADARSIPEHEALGTLRELLDYAESNAEQKPVIVVPDERFASKGVTDAGAVRMAVIRSAFTLCTRTIEEACKPGRYLSLCVTALEQACMWAIKSVSHEPKADGVDS